MGRRAKGGNGGGGGDGERGGIKGLGNRRLLWRAPRASLLVSPTPEGRRQEVAGRRRDETELRLRIQEVRLEQIRLQAEEREKDRELERFRIEQRRILREEREQRERIRAEDDAALKELEDGLRRTRERMQKRQQERSEGAAAEAQGGGGGAEAPRPPTDEERIAAEVARLVAGTWEPPSD
jgi:hypothetical protein